MWSRRFEKKLAFAMRRRDIKISRKGIYRLGKEVYRKEIFTAPYRREKERVGEKREIGMIF